jgi:threonine/homoserine/homoserine lactone efflux protein
MLLGLLHGLSPEHGWPLAVSFALKKDRRFLVGAISGFLLGIGHLLSSIAIVLLFLLFGKYLNPSSRLLEVLAGLLLIGLGIKEFLHIHHHGEESEGDQATLSRERRGFFGLLLFAILLGFAHEEEFQILGICAGEITHCFSLMILYAGSVILALTLATLLFLHSPRLLPLKGFERFLPWLTGILLLATGVRYLLE